MLSQFIWHEVLSNLLGFLTIRLVLHHYVIELITSITF